MEMSGKATAGSGAPGVAGSRYVNAFMKRPTKAASSLEPADRWRCGLRCPCLMANHGPFASSLLANAVTVSRSVSRTATSSGCV